MLNMHRIALKGAAALAVLATFTLFACFSEDDDGTGPDNGNGNDEVVEIRMTPNLTFDPAHVEIEAGQRIRWVNTSTFVHTATGDPAKSLDPDQNVRLPAGANAWDSGDVPGGGTFEKTFDVAGDYTYFCDPHETQQMVGTITVNP